MSYGPIVVTENPVTSWEQWHDEFFETEYRDLRVVKREMGGYWSMRFEAELDQLRARQYLSQGAGRDVKLFYRDGRLAWEGYINTVTLNTGTARVRTTLEDMGNYVWVRHQPIGGGAVTRSTVAENADSQARFGYKHFVIAGGELSAAVADQMAQKWLGLNYWPRPVLEEITLEAQPEPAAVTLQCLGYYHTLDWCVYNQTVLTTEADADTVVTNILADAQVGQFIATTDIRTNVTQVAQEYDADRRAADILESIATLGDVSYLPWVVGVGPGREFYYRPAARPY